MLGLCWVYAGFMLGLCWASRVLPSASHMINYVMDESIASDGAYKHLRKPQVTAPHECDECAGKIPNSSETKNNVETEIECSIENSLETEFSQMPSPPSQKQTKTQRGQETTVNKSAITD